MIGALIGAAASVAGAAISAGGSSTSSTVNYKQMVRKAQEAGFNPLTALRNGGSAGFTNTQSTSPLASGQFIANAIGGFGNAISQGPDPLEIERRQLETDLVRAQLNDFKSRPPRRETFRVPSQTAPQQISNPRPALQRGPAPKPLQGDILVETSGNNLPVVKQTTTPQQRAIGGPIEIDDPKTVNPYPLDWKWRRDPQMKNAEAFEDAHGDGLVTEPYSAYSVYRDFVYNKVAKFDDQKKRYLYTGKSKAGYQKGPTNAEWDAMTQAQRNEAHQQSNEWYRYKQFPLGGGGF